jgi:hypothetical protein
MCAPSVAHTLNMNASTFTATSNRLFQPPISKAHSRQISLYLHHSFEKVVKSLKPCD